MSMRALLRRSREARGWLLDAMAPLWCQAAFAPSGGVIAGLDLNHRAPETPVTDPVAAARLGAALARLQALDPGNEMISEALERMPGDPPEGPDADTLQARAAWLLAHALARGKAPGAQRALPAGLAAVVETANAQATRLLSGKAFRAAGLPTWFDACLALAEADRGNGHIGRASGLAAAMIAFLGNSPEGLFARAGEPVEVAEQFNWSWRLADHARMIGAPVPGESGRLYRFALGCLDAQGVAPAQVAADGTPVRSAMTLAAQAAALMAHLTVLERETGPETAGHAAASFDALMDNHLTPEGGWIGAYDGDGLPADQQILTRHADTIARAFSRLIDIAAAR